MTTNDVARREGSERALMMFAAAVGLKSLAQLGAVAKVSKKTLSRALHGTHRPHPATVERVAAALEVPAPTIELIFAAARRDRAC